MLLIKQERIEQEILTETANWYGLDSTIPRMYRPIDKGADADDGAAGSFFPSAQEYAMLKDRTESHNLPSAQVRLWVRTRVHPCTSTST